jgi:hypothetical protein
MKNEKKICCVCNEEAIVAATKYKGILPEFYIISHLDHYNSISIFFHPECFTVAAGKKYKSLLEFNKDTIFSKAQPK